MKLNKETHYMDMLYLELSQFTSAITKKEIDLQAEVARLRGIVEGLECTCIANGFTCQSCKAKQEMGRGNEQERI